MFRVFENLVNPYPSGEPGTPPRGLLPFILHFSRLVLGLLVAMSLVTVPVSALSPTTTGGSTRSTDRRLASPATPVLC